MPRSSLSSRARLAVLPWLPKARVGLLLSPPSLSPSTPRATTLQTTLHLLRCPSASCVALVPMWSVLPPAVSAFSLLGGGPMMLRQHTDSASLCKKNWSSWREFLGRKFNRKESCADTHAATSNLTFEQQQISTSPPLRFFLVQESWIRKRKLWGCGFVKEQRESGAAAWPEPAGHTRQAGLHRQG